MSETLFKGDDLSMGFDPVEAVESLSRSDRVLGEWIDKVGALNWRIEQTHGPYEALGVSILHQQLTAKAAEAILTKLKRALNSDARFPPARQIMAAHPEMLRSVGLSGAKMLAVKDLARRALDGTVPAVEDLHGMSDDAIVERLTTVRGIGRWTVEMMLIFRLGRPDVLPIHDYGVRKGFAKAFSTDLPTPKELAAHGERWRPYRSVASWYLWRVSELR